ncbi:hypothetical protein ACJMK2_035703 [Sinanodonta woodiana]|uniref:Uncharacterized protein n=1 Tax=Sinanodonta woodiana TaxID=1069815 RepID=A0ABD3WX41_SINWO
MASGGQQGISHDLLNVGTLTLKPGTAIPVEILNMDDRSIQLFKNALKDGKENVYSIRVMVVGHKGVGKTTLIKRLLGKDVNISERRSTEGIDVHLHFCDVSLSSHEWTSQKKESEQDYQLQRLAKVFIEKQVWSEAADEKQLRSEAADENQVTIPQKIKIGALDLVAEEQNFVSHLDWVKASQQVGSPVFLRNPPKSYATTMVISETGENVSSESRMEDPIREMLQLLQKNADIKKQDLGKYYRLTVGDISGPCAFCISHQMFLTRRAICLLVSDLRTHLEMDDDEFDFFMKRYWECEAFGSVQFWMKGVHSRTPDNEIMNYCIPSYDIIPFTCIFVGTHADAIQQDYHHEICENHFRKIRSYLKEKPSMFHLIEEDFAIDNTIVDSKLEALKRKIVEVASQQPYWGEEIPSRWLLLEQVLMNIRAQGYKVIHRSVLENINKAGSVQISTEELDLFLRFQHEIGAILYFSTELLKEKIVLEPLLMINAIKSLFAKEAFFQIHHLPLSTMWQEFTGGKLSPELIDAVWTKDRNADLHDNKADILLLMEQLNIIAKPRLFIDDVDEIKEVNYFLVPCMLDVEPPREVIFPEPHEQMESSSVMCYVFTRKFLPAPIFHRLLAACIAQWPLATKKMKKTLENQIFCNCGVFQIDNSHKLTLHCLDYIIFMRVTRQGIKDKTPSSKLCIEVKESIAKVLNKVIGYLGHSLMFEEFIQCPEYTGQSVKSLIPVALLKENAEVHCDLHDNMIESNKFLKFWFDVLVKNIDSQDKDDAGAPITQEHVNHARLYYALTTGCSRALRDILLTNVPMPYKDIYNAILANKARLKKLLNKDQVKLVFPDPQGLTTGKVEEFDTSLLYTMIRNVSSVPAPLYGWGKPQNDNNPRDTTLGASVERIQIYRKHISGHFVDGKISRQEFVDYWAKIDEVLREIENVIGNHGYLEDLEKIKNQAITPHEARELQKTFQEYKKQTEGNPLEAVRLAEVLLAIISDKSIETILQMTTSLQKSKILDIERRNVSKHLQHIHEEGLTQSERMKADIFKAFFESCKSDLLSTLKSGEYSDDILRSALQYILPIDDPSAKAAILNVAGANLKSKLSNPDCDVWGGLDVRTDSKCIVSLVCLHNGNLNSQPDSHLGLPVLYREYDRIEREPFDASFSNEYHSPISSEDLRRAKLLINRHGEELFKKHTNLVAVSPCSVLSSKSRGLKIEPSIVLYCRMKGIIPIGEDHFPKTLELEGIIMSTDIREGLFTFLMYKQTQQQSFRPADRMDKLRMGCSIGRESNQYLGTLGPFVRKGPDVCFITCAHAIEFEKGARHNQTIVQPGEGDSVATDRACGTVLDVQYDDQIQPVSVDAALIKVNNRDVAPTDFAWLNPGQLLDAGFGLKTPPSFLGGTVRMDIDFSDAQGKRVIKSGSTTGLTKGSLALNGMMIRIQDCRYHFPERMNWNELCSVVMKNQYMVQNHRYPFCTYGDSGAGVYLVENEQNKLSLIGILVGLLNEYSIVTPIGPVLESLHLSPEDVIADELVQVTTKNEKLSTCTLQ